ncbi:MAG: hypothetical protein RJA57_635 [Bacteroidota bacterium]|jgi:hypothetical protein
MIHIVFNESDVKRMHEVIALDPTLEGPVLLIRDDFAVGPITAIDTDEGWRLRSDWWRTLLKGSPYGEIVVDDRDTVAELQTRLTEDPELECWVWMGQNQHDVMGYYWLIPHLRMFQGRIFVLYMNNLPFINEKGQLFYPAWLHEIQPREFTKAKKLARPVTLSEFELDPDEWRRLSAENAPVRILEGGKKISGREADFFDADIVRNVSGEWQKASRILTNTLNRMKVKTGDLYLMYRIRHLVDQGRLMVMGDMHRAWKDFDLRKPEGKQGELNLSAETAAG